MEGEGDEKRLGERQRGRETGRNKKTETEMGQTMLEKDKTEGKQTDGLRKEGSDVRWGYIGTGSLLCLCWAPQSARTGGAT